MVEGTKLVVDPNEFHLYIVWYFISLCFLSGHIENRKYCLVNQIVFYIGSIIIACLLHFHLRLGVFAFEKTLN